MRQDQYQSARVGNLIGASGGALRQQAHEVFTDRNAIAAEIVRQERLKLKKGMLFSKRLKTWVAEGFQSKASVKKGRAEQNYAALAVNQPETNKPPFFMQTQCTGRVEFQRCSVQFGDQFSLRED